MANVITRTGTLYTHNVLLCDSIKATTRFVDVETEFKSGDTSKKAKQALAAALAGKGVKPHEMVVVVNQLKETPVKKWMLAAEWNLRAHTGEPTKEAIQSILDSLMIDDDATPIETE